MGAGISLTDTLYEFIERINDDDLDEKGLDIVLKKAKAINDIGKTIIEERKNQLDVAKFLEDNGYEITSNMVKQLGYEKK